MSVTHLPQISVGTYVLYSGANHDYHRLFAHPLQVRVIRKGYAACIQSDGALSPWIPLKDLSRIQSTMTS
jgi:hypothetical protein